MRERPQPIAGGHLGYRLSGRRERRYRTPIRQDKAAAKNASPVDGGFDLREFIIR